MEIAGYLLSVPVDFKIALARIRFSHHVILLLKVREVTGYGEGILYQETLQKAAEIFHTLLWPKVEDLQDIDELVAVRAQLIDDITAQSPAVAYAFDTAVWDVLENTKRYVMSMGSKSLWVAVKI